MTGRLVLAFTVPHRQLAATISEAAGPCEIEAVSHSLIEGTDDVSVLLAIIGGIEAIAAQEKLNHERWPR